MKKAMFVVVATAVLFGGYTSVAGADPVRSADVAEVSAVESVKRVAAAVVNQARHRLSEVGMDIGPICICGPTPPPPPITPDDAGRLVELAENKVRAIGSAVGMDIGPICICGPTPPPPPIKPPLEVSRPLG